MNLDTKQVETLIQYLKRWKTPECAICGQDDWAVADTVFYLQEESQAQFRVSPPPQFYPCVPITCKTCGSVLLVSAIAAGVIRGLFDGRSET